MPEPTGPATPTQGEIDMFGVGSGGPALTWERVSSAMRQAPRQGLRKKGLPSPEQEADDMTPPPGLADDALGQETESGDPAQADGVEAALQALEKKVAEVETEAALNTLFAEPNWDDIDDLPPPI